ncbi:hypothetical protein PTI98_002145 [Pleurotus ostreatus]|nr:hypothetical protein PTI98_002145 [Pleurotus ostreatus]
MGDGYLKLVVRIPIISIEQEPAHHPDVDEREALHDFEEPTDGVVWFAGHGHALEAYRAPAFVHVAL